MVFIITHNEYIFTTCDNLDGVYHTILTYARIILFCDKNKTNYFNNLKIVEYVNGIPIKSYYIEPNTLDLYDENKNKINIKNKTIQRNKIELEVLLKKDVESEINLFIPINEECSELSSDNNYKCELNNIFIDNHKNEDKEQKQFVSIKNLEKKKEKEKEIKEQQIKLLKEKIELEKLKLDKTNESYNNKMNKYLDNKHQYGLIDIELKNKKEKEEENLRVFNVDKNTFTTIMNEINEKIRDPDDIPDIFKTKFLIFQKLKSESEYQHLTNSEEYDKYIEIQKELNIKGIDIKTQYDNMFASNSIYNKLYNDLNDINNETEDNIDEDDNIEEETEDVEDIEDVEDNEEVEEDDVYI